MELRWHRDLAEGKRLLGAESWHRVQGTGYRELRGWEAGRLGRVLAVYIVQTQAGSKQMGHPDYIGSSLSRKLRLLFDDDDDFLDFFAPSDAFFLHS